jgi:two-component system, NarL family, response regulator LiaR
VRVLVADRDPTARHALREGLKQAGLSVVGQAAVAAHATSLARRCMPDVVVMNSTLPPAGGIAALPALTAAYPRVRVVVLGASGDDDTGLAALASGAAGYLARDLKVRSLARAVARTVAGEAAISRAMTRRVIERLGAHARQQPGVRPVKSPLTSREWEVLDLVRTGASSSDIARELVLTVDTVNSHVHHILRKLNAHSRSEAVALAYDAGHGRWGSPHHPRRATG